MMRSLLIVTSALALTAGAYDIHDQSLTPVKEGLRPSGQAMEFVREGRLTFALAADLKAETRTRDCHAAKSIDPAVRLVREAFVRTVGVAPDVVDTGDAARLASYPFVIAIGDSPIARANGVWSSELPDDGFTVATFTKGLVIAGNDSSLVEGFNAAPLDRRGASKGTWNGAVDFVERFLGVRFFFPGEYGTYWPKIENLAVSPVRYSDSPWFRGHGSRYYYVRDFASKVELTRLQGFLGEVNGDSAGVLLDRWRCGGTGYGGGHHCPEPHEFLRRHPGKERTIFYTSPHGKFWYNPSAHVGNYYNVLDLSFADLLADDYVRFVETDGKYNPGFGSFIGGRKSLSFGVCDTYMPVGEVLNDPTVRELGLIADADLKRGKDAEMANIYGRFYQHLGTRLKTSLPEATLWLLIYYNSTWAPRDPRWKLPDNIEINFCARDLPLYTRNAKKMEETRRMLQAWYDALGGRPAQKVWLYNSRHNAFARAVAPEFIADIPKLFGKLIGRNGGLFYDWDGSRDIWSFYTAGYIAAKSQWNPDIDVDAAVDDHWDKFYGPRAGPCLKRFHRVLKDAYLAHFVDSDSDTPMYPPAVIDELERCLKAAESELSQDSVEMKRYRLFADPWPKAFAQQRSIASYRMPVYAVARKGSEAPPVPLMDPKGSGKAAESPTDVRLWWDEKGVYGKAEFGYAPKADRSGNFWSNDTFEMFFVPGLGKEQVYMLAFDATGRVHTERQRRLPIPQPVDLTWKCRGHEVSVSVSNGRWSAEFYVPFTAFDEPAPKVYDTWNFNLVRTRRSGSREIVGNSLTMGDNHDVVMFGAIKFAGAGDSCRVDRKTRKSIELNNGIGRYPFTFSTARARESRPDFFSFKPSEFRDASRSGISSLINWFELTVNGIGIDRLMFDAETVREWREQGDRQGVDFQLVYDDARMDVRFWLEPGSPVLHGTIAAAEPSKIRSANLRLVTIPSFLAQAKKGQTRFQGYNRTVERIGDWYFFGDRDFDGGGADASRGSGPTGFLIDEETTQAVKPTINGSWTSCLDVTIDPFKTLRFGVYENFGSPKRAEDVRKILKLD